MPREMKPASLMSWSTLVVLVSISAGTAHADPTLRDGNGHSWQIDSDDGGIRNGTPDAFDGWPTLCITDDLSFAPTDECPFDDTYRTGFTEPTTGLAGREIITATVSLANLRVHRRIYVPDGPGQGWARYMEVLENPASTPTTVRLRVGTVSYGSLATIDGTGSFDVLASSDGGEALHRGLYWFTTGILCLGCGDSTVGFVMDGPGGSRLTTLENDVFGYPSRSLLWEYDDITVPARGTVAVVYFLTHEVTHQRAAVATEELSRASITTMAGIPETYQVINWDSPICGDSVLEDGEECDDGNADRADACTDVCRNATCGDGRVYAAMEECDDGMANADTRADRCRTDCTAPRCGDGVVDTGEGCDDGAANGTGAGACPSDCAEVGPSTSEDGGAPSASRDRGGCAVESGKLRGSNAFLPVALSALFLFGLRRRHRSR